MEVNFPFQMGSVGAGVRGGRPSHFHTATGGSRGIWKHLSEMSAAAENESETSPCNGLCHLLWREERGVGCRVHSGRKGERDGLHEPT